MLDVFTVGGETLCGNAPLIVTLNRAGTAYDNVMFGGANQHKTLRNAEPIETAPHGIKRSEMIPHSTM